MYIHALFENLAMEVFEAASTIFNTMCDSWNPKALNTWDLSSKHMTLNITSFMKEAIKASIPAILWPLLDDSK